MAWIIMSELTLNDGQFPLPLLPGPSDSVTPVAECKTVVVIEDQLEIQYSSVTLT